MSPRPYDSDIDGPEEAMRRIREEEAAADARLLTGPEGRTIREALEAAARAFALVNTKGLPWAHRTDVLNARRRIEEARIAWLKAKRP